MIASDLAMEAIRASGQDASDDAAIKTKLELQLSAYGRAVEPVGDNTDVTEEMMP